MKMPVALPRNTAALALQDTGSLPADLVRRDADGLPVAFRLFGFGPFRLTQDGREYGGEFRSEHADEILAQAEAKGTPVPLDAHHALAALAGELGVEEGALAEALPGKRLALGFGRLARREDGLWLEEIRWTDLGRRMLAGGHFRYFSPVLRGLGDGRLRITSVALTNNPALQQLDAIAASDDDDGCRETVSLADLVTARAAYTPDRKGEQPVKKLLELLGAVLGLDAIALADDGAVPADVETKLTQLRDELPLLRAGRALAATVRDCLKLAADADAATVEGTLRGLLAKAGAHDDLKLRVDALELEAETAKRAKVIERGLAEGKLTKAMIEGDWCRGQNAVALEAFLAVAPVVVPQGRAVDAGTLPREQDSLELSDGEIKVLRTAGMTEKDIDSIRAERKARKGKE